jgi:uncharacterized protein with von Willebrand factor type A (vWA) domain
MKNHVQQGGGTNFSNPLESANEICKNTHSDFDEIIFYFMSDGHSGFPDETIKKIKSQSYIDKLKFVAVGFGRNEFPVLDQMSKAFKSGKMM